MITDTEFKMMCGIEGGRPGAIIDRDRYILYNKWLVLELPPNQVAITGTLSDRVMNQARQWKYTQLPEGETGEEAMVFRTRWYNANQDDEEEVYKLSSDTAETFIHPDVYELLRSVLDSPVFRIFRHRLGEPPHNIAVYDGDTLVGALAPYVPDGQGELTVSD